MFSSIILEVRNLDECPNLPKCGFFQKYKDDENLKAALQGFMQSYCKGTLQDQCIRKKVSKALGGPDKVPVNMKPDGAPVIGTTDADWSAEVKDIVKQNT